jgi:uncharacterized RDD family membrane protein YckC
MSSFLEPVGDRLDGSQEFVASIDVAIDLPVATAGSRGLAHTIDLLLLTVLQAIVLLIAFVASAALSGLGAHLDEILVAVAIIATFAIEWGYFVAFELAWEGQTPGKRALGLRVVDETGGRATFTKIAIRNLLRVVDFLPVLYGAGLLVMLSTARGQRIGDLAAGTLVVTTAGARRTARTWPPGFQGKDVQLVERWFDQRATLTPQRRQKLALDLAGWLRRTHADALPRDHQELDPEMLLERTFPLAPEA